MALGVRVNYIQMLSNVFRRTHSHWCWWSFTIVVAWIASESIYLRSGHFNTHDDTSNSNGFALLSIDVLQFALAIVWRSTIQSIIIELKFHFVLAVFVNISTIAQSMHWNNVDISLSCGACLLCVAARTLQLSRKRFTPLQSICKYSVNRSYSCSNGWRSYSPWKYRRKARNKIIIDYLDYLAVQYTLKPTNVISVALHIVENAVMFTNFTNSNCNSPMRIKLRALNSLKNQ